MRTKLSKPVAYLLMLCMLISLLPTTAFAIPATHSHAICGVKTCTTDHNLDGTAENHGSVTWTAWNGTGTPSGNVYLSQSVTITSAYYIRTDTTICLNGNTITRDGSGSAFCVESGASLTICDCTGVGKIIYSGSYTMNIRTGTLNLYSGTIEGGGAVVSRDSAYTTDAYVNVYGGTIRDTYAQGSYTMDLKHIAVYGGSVTSDAGQAVLIQTTNATCKILGGTLSGESYGVRTWSNGFELSGNPTISGATADISLRTGKTITIDGELTASAPKYSVSMETPGIFTSGWNTYMSSATISDYFVSADDDYVIKKDATSGELVFEEIPTTFTANVNLKKDNQAWADSGKVIKLYQNGSAKYSLINANGTYTRENVQNGTYDVYVDGSDSGIDVSSATAVNVEYFTISYDKGSAESGNVPASAVVLKGSDYTISTEKPLTLTGYTMKGWTSSNDEFVSLKETKLSSVTSAVTLRPVWTLNTATINPTIKYGNKEVNANTTELVYAENTDVEMSVDVVHAISNLDVSYEWADETNGSPRIIEGVTGNTYSAENLTEGTYKFHISINYTDKQNGTERGSNGQGYDFTITIKNPIAISGSVSVSGDAVYDKTLTANYTGNETVTYQWYRGNDIITGATSENYTLVEDDIGKIIKVVVTGTGDYNGTKEYVMTSTVSKSTQTAPTPAKEDETIKNKKDGKITGVDSAMEYKKQGDADYTAITGTEIINLATGTYLVRYKETTTHSASEDNTLVIAEGKAISATFAMGGHGTAIDGQSGKAYGDKVTEPTAPTDAEWKFIGWYKENTFTNTWDFASDTLKDDTAIYAKWQEKKSVTVNETVQTYYYDGSEKAFVLSGTDAGLAGFDIQYKIDGTYGTAKPTEFGSYDVKVTRAYDDDYKAYEKEIIGGLVIAQSGTEFADKQILKDGTPTTIFTYGDTITVKIKPQATGAAPATFSLRSAPTANQMALFYHNGTEDIQISNAADVDSDGYYTLEVDTTENLVTPTNGKINLTAKYVGNSNMADYSEAVEITFNKAESSLTAPTAIENLVYDESEHTLINEATDVVGGTVKYKLEGGEYNSELPKGINAVTYTVYYKVFGDSYHNDSPEQSISITIAEKTINPVITLASPVANETPVTGFETDEYTVVVTWSPEVTGNFDYSTEYTAAIVVTPKANYTVTGIAENGYTIEGAAVTNEANSGNITAVFAKTGSRPFSGGGITRYTVEFDTAGGSAIANKTVTRKSTFAEPTEPTKDGYTFVGWFTDEELTKAYDFETKVTANITLYAKWEKVDNDKQDENDGTTVTGECDGTKADHCPAADFTDVDTTAWYHESLDYVLANGLMNGTAADKVEPDANLTRAMLVTILYRAEGEPATNRSIPFADVDMGSWYANAVIWAQQNNIVTGITETEFAPNDNITREQIATILYRYAILKGMDAVTLAENLGFADADEISEYAVSAMNWAAGTGLIKGYEDNTVRPQNNATRAEAAALLQRFIEEGK